MPEHYSNAQFQQYPRLTYALKGLNKFGGAWKVSGPDLNGRVKFEWIEEGASIMKSEPIVVERTYHAPSAKVWKAITDKNDMKNLYIDIAEFEPVVGFEFSFPGGTEEKQYTHLCKVTEVIPGKKLTYSWRYAGYEGNSFVTFELSPEGEQTRLKLTHEGVETFPEDNPDFARKNFVEGWTSIMDTTFKEFVETSPN